MCSQFIYSCVCREYLYKISLLFRRDSNKIKGTHKRIFTEYGDNKCRKQNIVIMKFLGIFLFWCLPGKSGKLFTGQTICIFIIIWRSVIAIMERERCSSRIENLLMMPAPLHSFLITFRTGHVRSRKRQMRSRSGNICLLIPILF